MKIEYWLLPYVNMVIECLQAQSAAGAVPHLIGILTGHVYHFFSVVWPKMGGRRYLAAPGMLEAVMAQEKKDAGEEKGSGSIKIQKKEKNSKKKSGGKKAKKGGKKKSKKKG